MEKRSGAEREIVDTERSYYARLTVLHEVFVQGTRDVLNRAERAAIFQNIDELLLRSGLLLDDLRRAPPERIADVFSEHVRHFACFQKYCAGHCRAAAALAAAKAARTGVAERLSQLANDPRCASLDLQSYLLEPVQRVARYPLLLRQLLHYTPRSHASHTALMAAVDASERVVAATNEAVRLSESSARLAEFERRIVLSRDDIARLGESFKLSGSTRVNEPRLVLCEFDALQVRNGKPKRPLCLLVLSDMVLILSCTKNDFYALHNMPLPISDVSAAVIDGRDGSLLELSAPEITLQLAVEPRSEIARICSEVQRAKACFLRGVAPKTEAAVPVQQCMGTVLVVTRSLIATGQTPAPVVLVLELNGQSVELPPLPDRPLDWGATSVVLSMASFDDRMRVALYRVQTYGPKVLLGAADVSLDVLEYYGERSTEGFTVPVPPVGVFHLDMQFSPV